MSKPYVVFLNGPPGSGKDYAAKVLEEAPDLTVVHYKFAEPLKEMASALLEAPVSWIEQNKQTILPLYGVNVRQILIDISEKYMKPCYGKDIFGKIAAEHISEEMQWNDANDEEQPDIYVFSDCGFDSEVHHVLKLFGNENALLVRLYREGHSYEGDSRSYIELPDVLTSEIYNKGDEKFETDIINTVKNWMGGKK